MAHALPEFDADVAKYPSPCEYDTSLNSRQCAPCANWDSWTAPSWRNFSMEGSFSGDFLRLDVSPGAVGRPYILESELSAREGKGR